MKIRYYSRELRQEVSRAMITNKGLLKLSAIGMFVIFPLYVFLAPSEWGATFHQWMTNGLIAVSLMPVVWVVSHWLAERTAPVTETVATVESIEITVEVPEEAPIRQKLTPAARASRQEIRSQEAKEYAGNQN